MVQVLLPLGALAVGGRYKVRFNRLPALLVPLASALLLAACATTPADRIQRHPDIYAQATREQQSLITQGRIALGFTPAFVRLALGMPDRVTEQTTPKGTETVWHYLEPGYAYGGYGPGYWGGYGGGPFWGGPYWGGPYWGPYFGGAYVVNPPYRDRDRVRVVFKDGRVAAFNRVIKED